jgi:hypothetical protein
MINYDRRFIKNITTIMSPLYKLLKKGEKYIWSEEQDVAFKKIKNEMKKRIQLTIPNFEKHFVLETDASNIGIGACLMQEDKAIAYISRSLNGAEKRYSITEKEMLAAIWAMEKLKHYLYGRRFTLITDHKAMEKLKEKLEFGSYRIHRWFKRIERFDFLVKYKEGGKMVVSDALNRSDAPKEGKEWEIL